MGRYRIYMAYEIRDSIDAIEYAKRNPNAYKVCDPQGKTVWERESPTPPKESE